MQTQAKPSGCAPAVVPSSLFSECIKAFYFMISSLSPALNTGVHSEVRADFCSTSTSERRVGRHKFSPTADSHLAYSVLQKTSSTRKVFSFCQSGTDLQNRVQMATEQWLRCKPSIEASGTFPSLTSSFESPGFSYSLFWRHTSNVEKYQKVKITVERIKIIKMQSEINKTKQLICTHIYLNVCSNFSSTVSQFRFSI